MQYKEKTVAIVGMGHVGATAAYAVLLSGICDRLILYARELGKAEGEKLDLEHGLAFLSPTEIIATDNFANLSSADVIFFTAGAAQEKGETRLDLVKKNSAIINSVIPEIAKNSPNSIIVIVANPVDILTYQAANLAKLPQGRVFGSGTMLDTARFRFHLSEIININPRSIHAYIMGEHGDSSFPVLSSATVGGQPLSLFPNYSEDKALSAFEQTKKAAYNIIAAKGATYYAIGVVIAKLARTILQDSRTVLPVSIPVTNYYGVSDIALSVPCIVGANGVEQILTASLSEKEQEQLQKSADVLKQLI